MDGRAWKLELCVVFSTAIPPELILSSGVSNAGLLLGALAIYNEDPTGTAAQILPDTIANSQQYCAHAISSDGTWLETPDYWSVTAMLSPFRVLTLSTGILGSSLLLKLRPLSSVQLAPTNKLSRQTRPWT